jgi:hypothetical protein
MRCGTLVAGCPRNQPLAGPAVSLALRSIYSAGLACAIAKGWLWKHESGTYVKFTPAGADLFA